MVANSYSVDKETGTLLEHSDKGSSRLNAPDSDELPPVFGKSKGRKFDSGKLDWTLMPFSALEDAVKVLMFGAEKYDRENWKLVDNGEQRYKAAGFRHMLASLEGEEFDPETGIRHTAHAMVNLIFAEWLRKEREDKK